MAVTYNTATPQIITNYGLVKGLPAAYPRPFADMFLQAPLLPGTISETIKWRYQVDKTKAAQLMKRGGNHGVSKIEDTYFVTVSLKPGVIEAIQSLTAEELTQMKPKGLEEWLIDGQSVPTSQMLAADKFAILKESILERINIMASQIINDGKVYFANGVDYWDFDIPTEISKTYSTSNGIIKIVSEALRDFQKVNRKLPTDFLIGETIATKMLEDAKFQTSMRNLNYSNVAGSLTANEKALVIGQVMGQQLEQMNLSFDENGVQIIEGTKMKLVDRTQFRRGQGAIPAKNPTTKLPDFALMDYYPAIDEGTELNPTAQLILRNGFFPVVIDPRAIQTYDITIS